MGNAGSRIGGRIRELRAARRLTQEKLAEAAGLTGKYLGKVERGQMTISLDNLERIASSLGIQLIDLLDAEHEKDDTELQREIYP